MWLLWLCAAVAAIIVAAVLSSDIHVKVMISRHKGNDHMYMDVKAIYGLIKRRFDIPVLHYKDVLQSLVLKLEHINESDSSLASEQQIHINIDKWLKNYRNYRNMLAHTFEFSGWMNDLLKHVRCTQVTWTTNIGIGDAADTAFVVGVVWSVKSMLLRYLLTHIRMQDNPTISVNPQYNKKQFATELSGMAKLRLGVAVLSAFKLAVRVLKVKGGFKAWQQSLSQS